MLMNNKVKFYLSVRKLAQVYHFIESFQVNNRIGKISKLMGLSGDIDAFEAEQRSASMLEKSRLSYARQLAQVKRYEDKS